MDLNYNNKGLDSPSLRVLKKSLNHYLMRINRTIVWFLLLTVILLIVTGYGITKPELIYTLTGGLLDYKTAYELHTLLDLPMFSLLIIHVVIEVRFSLIRWGFKNNQRLLDVLLLALGSCAMVLFILIEVL